MESDNCLKAIESTIRNRSFNCGKLDKHLFLKAYILSSQNESTEQSKSIISCATAIRKYKKRLVSCGANSSLRSQRKNKILNNLYKINKIFKNNYE